MGVRLRSSLCGKAPESNGRLECKREASSADMITGNGGEEIYIKVDVSNPINAKRMITATVKPSPSMTWYKYFVRMSNRVI